MSSARALRLCFCASLPRACRFARAPGAVRTPRALERRAAAGNVGHEAARVEGVEHDACLRRRVGDPADVESAVLGRPEADEEAVGDEHHDLAAGHRGEAAHDAFDRGERAARAVHDLEHHAPRLRVGLLARARLAAVVLGLQDLLDRDAQRLDVAAVDQLGLVLAEVGRPSRLDRHVAARHAVDRAVQRARVAGEVLVDAHAAARRDERDEVVGRNLLVDEAVHRRLRRGQVSRRRVQVVDGEHEVAAARRPERGRLRRLPATARAPPVRRPRRETRAALPPRSGRPAASSRPRGSRSRLR